MIRSEVEEWGPVSSTRSSSTDPHDGHKSKFTHSTDGKVAAAAGSRRLEASTFSSTRRVPCRELNVGQLES